MIGWGVDEWTWMPDLSRLDVQALVLMSGWLESRLDRAGLVTQDDWREAYGAAVDDQTARAFRAELLEVAA